MNIGILIPGFSNGEQDWCIPVYLNLVRALAQTESVRVFAMRYPPRRDRYPVYGAQVFPLNGGSYTAGVRRWGLLARTVAAVIRQHRDRPFDVLHAIWADETGLAACVAGRIIGVPVVVSIAGGELAALPAYGLQSGTVSRWLVSHALAWADRITAPSTYAADLAKHYTNRIERIKVVALGVDTALFTLPAASEIGSPTGHRLLSVGSLIPVKGHDQALKLLSMLMPDFPAVTLDIVGEGPLLGTLRAQAEALGISERVTFHGAIPHDQLPRYYQSVDVHLLTSQHEAFGMVVVEAAACGVPTAGFALGVLPEFAPQAGIAVRPEDLQALAGELRDLLSNSERLGAMKAAAHAQVEARYTMPVMARGFLRVYRE